MDSRAGAESVIADHGIILGNRDAGSFRHRFAVFLQLGQVLALPGLDAEQLQVHQHLVHLGVADPLADSASRRMNHFCSRHQRGDGICDRQAAIAMTVPFDPNVLS